MTEPRLRHQTKSWLTTISADLRQALQQEVNELRTALDHRVSALESVVSRSDELFDEVALKVYDLTAEEAEAAATHERQQAESAAQSEISALRASLQTELETVRRELEASRTALVAQLAETERDISVIRRKRDEHAASLEEARTRIDTLEEAEAEARRLRQVADALLEEEVQRRTMVTTQLEAARQETRLAKAEAESCRTKADVAGERVNVLEYRLLQLEAADQIRTTRQTDSHSHIVLKHLKEGLDELSRARPDEVLSVLVEHLNRIYAAVAVFAVMPQGLRLWKSRADDSVAAVPIQVPSMEGESPLVLACKQRTTVSATPASLDAVSGLWQRPLGHAIALPILANGRMVAVAYGENPPDHSDELTRLLDVIAETLVCCVNQRLGRRQDRLEALADPQPSSQHAIAAPVEIQSDRYAVGRQAPRVKINSAVEILVDGIASTLVDVSALGAQIVSPAALKPNRCVRIALPSDSGGLTCEGRIVWVQLELPDAEASAIYRAGIRFVDVNPGAITIFVSAHGSAATSAVKLT